MTTTGLCRSCGRPFFPDHDSSSPGPTVRHPFVPAHPFGVGAPPVRPEPAKGRCSECGETVVLRADGKAGTHPSGTFLQCLGSGQPPDTRTDLERAMAWARLYGTGYTTVIRDRVTELEAENDALRIVAANWSDSRVAENDGAWTAEHLRMAVQLGYGIRVGRDSLPVLAELLDAHAELANRTDPIETGTEAALGEAEETIRHLRADIAERDAAIKADRKRYGRMSKQIGDLRNEAARLRTERNEARAQMTGAAPPKDAEPLPPVRSPEGRLVDHDCVFRRVARDVCQWVGMQPDEQGLYAGAEAEHRVKRAIRTATESPDLLQAALSALVAARLFGGGDERGWKAEVEAAIDRVSEALGQSVVRGRWDGGPDAPSPTETGKAAGEEFVEGARRYVVDEVVADADRPPPPGWVRVRCRTCKKDVHTRAGLPQMTCGCPAPVVGTHEAMVSVSVDEGKTWGPWQPARTPVTTPAPGACLCPPARPWAPLRDVNRHCPEHGEGAYG